MQDIKAREILDSRGFPTIECSIILNNRSIAVASVPSGASVGRYEAHELRDGDIAWFDGKGVSKAINRIHSVIAPALIEREPDVVVMDQVMLDLDGTKDKTNLGANAMLAVSMAVARAQALVQKVPLYVLLRDLFNCSEFGRPRCMFNILNGGMHAYNGLAFQEFMVVLDSSFSIKQSLNSIFTIYQALKKILATDGYATAVGDEGGFASRLQPRDGSREHAALDYLVKAINDSGFEGKDFIALDAAASKFYDSKERLYLLGDKSFSTTDLIEFYGQLCQRFPIISIEDGLHEDDWGGWQLLQEALGNQLQVVGDDLFVTNVERIQQSIEPKIANAAIIKPNQCGTVTESCKAIALCKEVGYKTIVSHRSGETNDDFIVDLTVGLGCDFIKAGASCRGERIAKYNRLMKIENELSLIEVG